MQHIRFYNLTTSITFSRASFTILSATSLSTPTPLPIPASSLLRALNTIFYRPNQSTNDVRYDRSTLQYRLTQDIGSLLFRATLPHSRGTTEGRDALRNALTLPLYAFQPTMLETNTSITPFADGSGRQPGLPPQNSLKGSYCRIDSHSVPGRGSVITYTAVGGLVLILVFGLKGWAARYERVEPSGVLMVDLEGLAEVVVAEGNERRVVRVSERVRAGGGDVWEGMEELWVRMGRGTATGTGTRTE